MNGTGNVPAIVVSVIAAIGFLYLAMTPAPVAVAVAATYVFATVMERRSFVWVILAGALLLISPLAVVAAVMVPPPGNKYALDHQGFAALRRGLAAVISPVFTAGAVVGAYRLGKHKQTLWWLIGWAPAILVSILALAFIHPLALTQTTALIAVIGLCLSLDSAPAPAVAPHEPLPVNPGPEPEPQTTTDRSRTVIAGGGGTYDWSEINPAAVDADRSRPTTHSVRAAENASSLAAKIHP